MAGRRSTSLAVRGDPEFRAEWVRTTLARTVAVAVVRYRAECDLPQRDLAQLLDMKRPVILGPDQGLQIPGAVQCR
jgi:ribosome-binding protein aMBF1 (putative translation factor)